MKNKIKDFFIKWNISKEDIILFILGIFAFFIIFTDQVNADYSWSNEKKSITDLEFKEIVSENTPYDVMNEDFTTYTGNYKYNNVLNAIFKDTYHKAFFDMGDNKLGIRYSTSPWKLSLSGTKYNLSYLITLVFDFTNKTLNYQNIDTNTEFFANKGWVLSGDTSSEEFQSYAYQQTLIYETYFLVLGEFYSTSNLLLNGVEDYEINEMSYNDEIYTGKIIFSYDDDSWITSDLSETFYSGDEKSFSYYLEAYDYTETGVSKGMTTEKLIGSINFSSDATYHPSVEQVEQVMKEIDGYMNYAYTISLRPFESMSTHLLSSDLFIVDAKPIALIPYFKYKYDYLYYGGYVTPPGDISSGDSGGIVVSPSGDETDIGGGIGGIWQAIVDLPKKLLEGLVGLFVPSSDYFYNEDPENLGLWQRISVYFQSKLGFLWDIITFIPNLAKTLITVIESINENWSITVPDLTIPEMTGVEEFTFLESFEWSPYTWVNQKPEFAKLYTLYLDIIDFFVYWGLIWFAADTLMTVLGNTNYIDDEEGDSN